MKKETWKPVTISGFTGILMGAASAYGMQAVMNGETSETAPEAKPVDYDSMSFKDAFEAARAQVGPGGVFTWHGNVYNTYTAAEWNAKTHKEQQEFAEQVEEQIAAVEPEATQDSLDGVEPTQTDDVRVVVNNVIVDDSENMEETPASTTTEEENDVRIIGTGEVELADGHTVTVQELEMNGQRVAVIDLDNDGVADVAMSDLNHNNQADEGEIIDLHTGEALSFTNDTVETSDDLPLFEA